MEKDSFGKHPAAAPSLLYASEGPPTIRLIDDSGKDESSQESNFPNSRKKISNRSYENTHGAFAPSETPIFSSQVNCYLENRQMEINNNLQGSKTSQTLPVYNRQYQDALNKNLLQHLQGSESSQALPVYNHQHQDASNKNLSQHLQGSKSSQALPVYNQQHQDALNKNLLQHLQGSESSQALPVYNQQHQDTLNKILSQLDMERFSTRKRSRDSIGSDEDKTVESVSKKTREFGPPVSAELSPQQQLANSNAALLTMNNHRTNLEKIASATSCENSTENSYVLALVQKALYNLHLQYEVQMHITKRLKDEVALLNRMEKNNLRSMGTPLATPQSSFPPTLSPQTSVEQPITSSLMRNNIDRQKSSKPPTEGIKHQLISPDAQNCHVSPSGASGGLPSSVIQYRGTPSSEVNTLEILQATPNQVPSNSSQGLLTNRLVDAVQKHPCVYCGEVFGYHSVLQAHLRCHAGEPPLKCNISKSRFTAEASSKLQQTGFHSIEMNRDRTTEIFDKLDPRVLPQQGQPRETPPPSIGPPSPSSPLQQIGPALQQHAGVVSHLPPPPLCSTPSLSTPSLPPLPLTRDILENLNWKTDQLPLSPLSEKSIRIDTSADETSDRDSDDSYQYKTRENFNKLVKNIQFNDINHEGHPPPLISPPDSLLPGMRISNPDNVPFIPGLNGPILQNGLPPPQPRPIAMPAALDLSKKPNIDNNLLRKPGNKDNSSKSLIDSKTCSETTKAGQFYVNQNRLEPNQCVMCHMVLSTPGTLALHYMNHTKEKQFKCGICNRTFSKKANLDNHMSVHFPRYRVDMLHQCHICYKKFENVQILHQHIALHVNQSVNPSSESIASAPMQNISQSRLFLAPHLVPQSMQLPQYQP